MHGDDLATAPHQSVDRGETITFGTYPQTVDGDDKTPIQWRVIQNSGEELLILSEYILDCKQYHGEDENITWCDCDLRRWLNDEFYTGAFDDAEKELVKTTLCTDHGEGSPDTEDKVFLLNVAEANRLKDTHGKDILRARGTEFAKREKSDGCHLYVMDKNVEEDYIHEGGQKYGCSWWWLRNQGRLKEKGNDPTRAVFIGTRVSIRHYARVTLDSYGVRPALKLNLSSKP